MKLPATHGLCPSPFSSLLLEIDDWTRGEFVRSEGGLREPLLECCVLCRPYLPDDGIKAVSLLKEVSSARQNCLHTERKFGHMHAQRM